MLVGIPAQCANAVAWLESEIVEGHGELFCAGDEVREGVTVERLVGAAGDDLAVSVELLGPPQDVGQGKLEVLGKSL